MPFVQRDREGRIVAVAAQHQGQCAEEVAVDDPQLGEFLAVLNEQSLAPLASSDQDFIRVLDDLVELLTAKGVILFTELPEFAQRKILNRRELRSQMLQALDLLEEEEARR